jgi:hypothetical protein
MGKQAVQQQEAIPILYDGPLAISSGTGDEAKGPAAFLRAALEKNLDPSSASICATFLSKVSSAKRIKDQLQVLQSFKSSIIQICRRNQSSLGDHAGPPSASGAFDDSDWTELSFVYQLLLEWSLGWKTPLPLRRTIHSILETLYDIHQSKDSLEAVFAETIESISASSGDGWKCPLDSLESLLSLAQLRPNLYMEMLTSRSISFLSQKASYIVSTFDAVDSSELAQRSQLHSCIGDGVKVALLAKTLLQGTETSRQDDLRELNALFWFLLRHFLTPADALPSIGMAYGGATTFPETDCAAFLLDRVQRAHSELPPLARECALQGLAANTPDCEWIFLSGDESKIDPDKDALRLFQTSFGETVQQAVDPEVRVAALKGIRTIVSRSLTLLNVEKGLTESGKIDVMRSVSDRLLEVVLQAWENPPTRKLANVLPGIFQSVVEWKEKLAKLSEKHSKRAVSPESSFHDELVDRLLAQPPYRKGRYNALECMLPMVGARSILTRKTDSCDSNTLLSDLLAGVGDSGHNTGAMADLWSKLLYSLFQDIHNLTETAATKKKKSKNEKTPEIELLLSKDWLNAWIPSLSHALISAEWKRRKQIAAFCLLRVLGMVGGRSDAAAQAFAAMLEFTGELVGRSAADIPSKDRETRDDRILWAMMEIVRYSSVEKKLTFQTQHGMKSLQTAIKVNLPLSRLCSGLQHSSATIRITSFQAMEGIVQSTHKSPLDRCRAEADLWRLSLPFAVKVESTGYLSTLLVRLLSFLDRLSRAESHEYERNASSPSESLPLFDDFVNNHLLADILVQRSTYPGSVLAKETFGLALLESIIVFSCRDLNLAFDCKLLPKTGVLHDRRRSVLEDRTLRRVQATLVGPDVVGALISMLQSSNWDVTKARSFDMLSTLIELARKQKLGLPADFFGSSVHGRMKGRALLLSSSPRQREADTGARMLALLCLSRASLAARMEMVEEMVSILEERVQQLKETLEFVMKPDTDVMLGRTVPLVHGIILSLRLIVESEVLELAQGSSVLMFHRLSRILCTAMQVSLAVVADVREGHNLEGMDDSLTASFTVSDDSNKGKVNPGMIGANGIFSSVSRIDAAENERRLASQHIVVGSWLLMKEACAAVATVLTLPGNTQATDSVNLAGTLLISTLTSLKHTGAAYAAHASLQRIVKSSLDTGHLSEFPLNWVDRLFREITSMDKVKDSTLRRSTGYALGFLSIMRSEIALRSVPRLLCGRITQQVLSLTLPPITRLKEFLSTIGLSPENPGRLFSYFQPETTSVAGAYSTRSRVHALNVMRMMILDAPLSQEIFPTVGDAMIGAIMGYVDSDWSVRNSAGMVFSAAMLRVVDADKNAANTDVTSKNAITLSELFQSYPSLYNFLLSVLRASVDGRLKVDGGNSLPPILPILVLLYRVQPLQTCGPDVVGQMQQFCPVILACIGHRHLSVRQAAARALSNLCGGQNSLPLSISSLYSFCNTNTCLPVSSSWNQSHGALLLLKEMRLSRRLPEELMVSTGHDKALLGFVCLLDGDATCPPLCIMTGVEVLHGLTSIADGLLQHLLGFIQWLSSDLNRALESPGMSEACSAVAEAACEQIVGQLFAGDTETAIEKVGRVSRLLECDVADIRIPATKCFKKLIYAGLDELTTLSNQDADRSDRILGSLVQAMTLALAKELSRDGIVHDTLGTHPPTLRRLSRCLLESLAAHQRCSTMAGSLVTGPIILELGQLILSREQLDHDELTPLVGNALELVSWHIDQNDSTSFFSLLTRLSSPDVAWRLRYSAACAVAQAWQAQSSLRSYCRPLMIQLLQDEDPDVRDVVGRAITGLDSQYLSVPECVLARFILKQEPTLEDARSFLESACRQARAVHSKLLALSKESEPSGSQRTIFEVEDPNSYHEPALQAQATLYNLWDCLTEYRDALHDLQAQLEDELARILEFLLNHEQNADVLVCSVFADLHGVVMASTSGYGNRRFQPIVQRLLERSGPPFYPSLVPALRLLGQKEPATRSQIQDCCFLIDV